MSVSLRATLRSVTAPLHDVLEAASPLAQPTVTPAQYVHALEQMWGWYATLEPRVLACPALNDLLPHVQGEGRKVPWLERDLDALLESDWRDRLPRCQDVPSSHTLPRAIGCAYVMEGATLGGRVLFKRFACEWDMTPETGGRFLCGYGEASGRLWQRFVAAIDAAPFDATERAQCTTAACETFESLRRWFERCAR